MVWYTAITWIPVAFVTLLPNDWYFVVLKVFFAVWFVSICLNLTVSAGVIDIIGDAGASFVISSLLFGFLCVSSNIWLRVSMMFVLSTMLMYSYRAIYMRNKAYRELREAELAGIRENAPES